MSLIIFLNGSSSSGKTSLGRSIQHLSPTPWLLLGADSFIRMMPDKFVAFGDQADQGYLPFLKGTNERGPITRVEYTPMGKEFFKNTAALIALLADQGNNLVIDEILLDDELLKSYLSHLEHHTVYFIGIFCELQIMQEREILRGNRSIGIANDQIDRVHKGTREYDLRIDTTCKSVFSLAKELLSFIENTPEPQGFQKMRVQIFKDKLQNSD